MSEMPPWTGHDAGFKPCHPETLCGDQSLDEINGVVQILQSSPAKSSQTTKTQREVLKTKVSIGGY